MISPELSARPKPATNTMRIRRSAIWSKTCRGKISWRRGLTRRCSAEVAASSRRTRALKRGAVPSAGGRRRSWNGSISRVRTSAGCRSAESKAGSSHASNVGGRLTSPSRASARAWPPPRMRTRNSDYCAVAFCLPCFSSASVQRWISAASLRSFAARRNWLAITW
jgi:hypothetical protein